MSPPLRCSRAARRPWPQRLSLRALALLGLLLGSLTLARGATATEERDAAPPPGEPGAPAEEPAPPEESSDAPEPSRQPPSVAPPLPAPRPEEQDPAPYVAPEAPSRRAWIALPSADVGLSFRSTDSDAVSYAPGISYGGSVRLEYWWFIAGRLGAHQSWHAVELSPAHAALDGALLQQPSVEVTTLYARLEPTWLLTDQLRLYLGLGLGWSRSRFRSPSLSSGRPLEARERSAVNLEWTASLGGWWELIPRWLLLGASLDYALASHASGEAYGSAQAFSQDGRRLHLPSMAPFADRWTPELHLGIAP